MKEDVFVNIYELVLRGLLFLRNPLSVGLLCVCVRVCVERCFLKWDSRTREFVSVFCVFCSFAYAIASHALPLCASCLLRLKRSVRCRRCRSPSSFRGRCRLHKRAQCMSFGVCVLCVLDLV